MDEIKLWNEIILILTRRNPLHLWEFAWKWILHVSLVAFGNNYFPTVSTCEKRWRYEDIKNLFLRILNLKLFVNLSHWKLPHCRRDAIETRKKSSTVVKISNLISYVRNLIAVASLCAFSGGFLNKREIIFIWNLSHIHCMRARPVSRPTTTTSSSWDGEKSDRIRSYFIQVVSVKILIVGRGLKQKEKIRSWTA